MFNASLTWGYAVSFKISRTSNCSPPRIDADWSVTCVTQGPAAEPVGQFGQMPDQYSEKRDFTLLATIIILESFFLLPPRPGSVTTRMECVTVSLVLPFISFFKVCNYLATVTVTSIDSRARYMQKPTRQKRTCATGVDVPLVLLAQLRERGMLYTAAHIFTGRPCYARSNIFDA